MLNKSMMSTGKDDWATPDDLFKHYDEQYHFVLDAAANEVNHKCAEWFGPGGVHEDARSADWGPWLKRGNVWMNPPYSKGLQSQFVVSAFSEVRKVAQPETDPVAHGKVVCLLPARTDTRLFHEIIQPYGSITFLKGRVKFKGASAGAPFPSMVVVFE